MKQKFFSWAFFFLYAFSFLLTLPLVRALNSGTVVINEVAWAGSADSSTDEWIELYNTSSQPVNLAQWTINDDNGSSLYVISSGTIAAHGYFLIEDHESTVLDVTADTVIDLSLANSGDSLQLFDAQGSLVDTVNGSGGAWFAGSATTKASMERIDPTTSGDVASNWLTATSSSHQASNSSSIIGTPRGPNSSLAQNSGQTITMDLSSTSPQIGDTVTLTLQAHNVTNLFSYGFDITYDPTVLQFTNASAGSFLSQSGSMATSFQAALQNGVAGTVVLGEARTMQANKLGVSGSGILTTLQFHVLSAPSNASGFVFGAASFAADPLGDLPVQFTGVTLSPSGSAIGMVSNAHLTEAANRYGLMASWDALDSATSYQVLRQDPGGQWKLLGQTSTTSFIDQDSVLGGGNIIPNLTYHYRIVALNSNSSGLPVDVSGVDTRGLKGDNNRSDRIDGRDLEQLARHFGELDTDSTFVPLADTNYDGQINGSDLIDLGLNFAQLYS